MVRDTGHTVNLLHRLYEIRYPDGTTEEVFAVEGNGAKPSETYERVKRRARRQWAQRQQGG